MYTPFLEILFLDLEQSRDALFGQGDQAVHGGAAEDTPFAGALDFDEVMGACHNYIEINLGVRIFGVAQVEQKGPIYDANTGGGNCCAHRMSVEQAAFE
jgi:hypothetical protein